MYDNAFQIYTKIWLRSFGKKIEDGLWHVPARGVFAEFTKILDWEVDRRSWYIDENTRAVRLNFDWDGDLSSAFEDAGPDKVSNAFEKIGLCTKGFGWPNIGELSNEESIWIMFNLNEYHYMISSS